MTPPGYRDPSVGDVVLHWFGELEERLAVD